MKLRALHSLITVKMDQDNEFAGMLVLPAWAQEKVDTATVIAAGPGEYDEKGKFAENPVKEGDRILLAKGSGVKVKLRLDEDKNEEEYIVVTPAEVTGIIRD